MWITIALCGIGRIAGCEHFVFFLFSEEKIPDPFLWCMFLFFMTDLGLPFLYMAFQFIYFILDRNFSCNNGIELTVMLLPSRQELGLQHVPGRKLLLFIYKCFLLSAPVFVVPSLLLTLTWFSVFFFLGLHG